MTSTRSPLEDDSEDAALLEVLERSRSLGFLGPGLVMFHVEHAVAFRLAIEQAGAPRMPVPAADEHPIPHLRVLDLGSGGGVPGLILARWLTETPFVLVDAMERRCRFLEWAVTHLDLAESVEVRCGRAEQLAHEPDLRGSFDVVVTRGFGPPAVTAECGAPFLRPPSGRLVISEPPEDGVERWPVAPLAQLGLVPVSRVAGPSSTVQVLVAHEPVPDRYPRRTGVPAKRPLY